MKLTAVLIFLFCSVSSSAGSIYTGAGAENGDALHAPYDALLQKYVSGFGVRYAAWAQNDEDKAALKTYIGTLESKDPAGWDKPSALAFWINLYNAETLNLILDNYPVKSIKDLGGLFKSPWNRKVSTVAGRELSLNDIENKIIRPQFKEARIHFAVNCAAVSCPPLSDRAYVPSKLDTQLTEATRRALADENWLVISEKEVRATKIFDWYEGDFKEEDGSVRAFIAKYVTPERKVAVTDDARKLKIMDYDWKLNQVK